MKVNKLIINFFAILILANSACSGEDKRQSWAVGTTTDSTQVADTTNNDTTVNTSKMNIKIGDKILTATLVDNSSTRALLAALAEAPISIEMSDYGDMEKVGSLGRSFPRNDRQITTQAGDLILYQGDKFVIYYDTNSWNFTKLGKIDNITATKLKSILGKDNVRVILSLIE